jgi:hypothetical protein
MWGRYLIKEDKSIFWERLKKGLRAAEGHQYLIPDARQNKGHRDAMPNWFKCLPLSAD